MASLSALLAARIPPELGELRPYSPDPTKVSVRLDGNEAPDLLPTLHPDERHTLERALAAVEPARYPDVRAGELRSVLAGQLGVSGDQLVFGCGSDEAISILLTTLARPAGGLPPSILIPTPTFVMYRTTARVHGYDVVEVPLDADWDLDEAKMLEAVAKARPAVVFLATPNNPTSGAYSLSRVERIVEAVAANDPPGVVVVDEAYLPFRKAQARDPWRGTTGLDLLAKHPNVVVMRTLSKVGMAALRVGWMVAHPTLTTELEKVRLPYNVPAYSQAMACCLLGPLAPAVERHVASIVEAKGSLLAALREFPQIAIGRVDANFVWLRVEGGGARLVAELKARDIMIKSFPAHPTHARITVGTHDENAKLLGAMRTVLGR